MEAATILVHARVSNRVVGCLWCHQPSSHSDVIRYHGLCRSCAQQCAEISWRIIYDRDRKIGSIPVNLRLAYGL